MADARQRLSIDDHVVLIDAQGERARDEHGRVMRGVVTRVNWRGDLLVSLERSGRQMLLDPARCRRCPQLAYTRPRNWPVGAS